jgi:putative CocE/NonD family hydrolase
MPLALLALVLTALGSQEEDVFDHYDHGIHMAELQGFAELPPPFDAVRWPDTSAAYVEHTDLGDAHRWVQPEASAPIDLVIGDDGRLLAMIDVSRDQVVVRPGFESLTPLAQWFDPDMSAPEFGVSQHGKFMVEMDDGVKLTTLVYLPEGAEGPFPVILIRTPYGIASTIGGYWHHVARGYAVVIQSCRGRAYWDLDNLSEGEWELVVNEPRDGADTLEWIVEQDWCDGNIGMQGGSYVGYTQWAATMADNPALKVIVPESSMGTVFSDQPYMGGGFVLGLAYYMFWMLDEPILPGRTWTEILAHRPLVDIDEFATGNDLPQWNALLENWRNDEYWQAQDWYAADLERDFSSLQISGWFDDDFPGTRANWALMQQRGELPQRLLIGPWKHGYNRDRRLNGYSFGPDALRDDVGILKQRWYDRFLKGIENGVENTVVEYFVLGENRWRTASAWPPEEVTEQPWYFGVDGGLTSVQPAEAAGPYEYVYDPADPPRNWMSFDGMTSWQDVQSFPFDARELEARDDVLTLTSAPLEEDLTIAGDVIAVLHASTDVKDTDWWVHLSDVHPDGESVRLTVGMLRARFRHNEDARYQISGVNFREEQLLSGDLDDVVGYEISIPSIANTFLKGHRIRIAVFNALDNYSFPNSNTGSDEAHVTATVAGTMRIHHGPDTPSHVLLPVLPSAAAADELVPIVQGYVDDGLIVGAELVVIDRRKVVLHEAFGWRDREDELPMERNTLFNIRSMTKPLTGAAIQLLVDEEQLTLDMHAADVLPGFDHDRSNQITIEELLTHRSGLPLTVLTTSIDQYDDLLGMGNAAGVAGPQFEPGSKFWYSDAGSDTLGAIVEVVSGQPLDDFVTERLLEPLGMQDTLYGIDAEDPRFGRFASLYVGSPGNWQKFWQPTGAAFYPFAWGSQTLYSTPLDYARFLFMWMDGGKVGDEELLSPAAIERTLTPASEMSALGSAQRMPCGFPGLETFYGQQSVLHAPPGEPGETLPQVATVIGHSGSDGTWAWAWPERDLVVLYFTQARGQATGLRLAADIDRLLIHPREATAEADTPEAYRPYLGTYVANFARFRNEKWKVLFRDGHLALDIPSQMIVDLDDADDQGRWYFEGTRQVFLTFDRGAGSEVEILRMHQGPIELLAPREGVELGEEMDPDELARYVGEYHAAAQDITATVLIQNNRLAIDWPGETLYPMHPPDAQGVWVFLASDAWRVTFEEDDAGEITSLVYAQPGAEIPMRRVE